MAKFDEDGVQRLVERAKEGDTDAFGAIYDAYFDRVYAYCAWRVASRQEAEDLAQTVFVKVLEALPRYVSRGASFRAWIFRIAHNLVANHYRGKRRAEYVEIDEVAGVLAASDSPPDEVIRDLSAEELRGALAGLTDEQHQVIVMKFIGGLSNEEISAVIAKPVTAVKALQHRGLASLGRLLGPRPLGTEADFRSPI